jgi:hypothetical protein
MRRCVTDTDEGPEVSHVASNELTDEPQSL